MSRLLQIFVFFLSDFLSYSVITTKPIGEEVYFYLYTKATPNISIELKTGAPLDQAINPKLPWKFFIHGYISGPTTPWYQLSKKAYFQNGDYNIVYVDWSVPSYQAFFLSILSLMDLGKVFGKLIIYLTENGVSLDDMHLIGHSLGSHLSGFAGKYARDNGGKVARITGLDPAGLFYEYRSNYGLENQTEIEPAALDKIREINPDFFQKKDFLISEQYRLSEEDANFVDVMHTDSGNIGITANIGHCNFLVNGGGSLQPGCETAYCDHMRAVELFAEFSQNNFVAKECSSYENFKNGKCTNGATAIMGENTNPNTRGIFYLDTNPTSPFGLGDI